MDSSDYQKLAARTLTDKPGFEVTDKDIMTVWNALGLVGEAGEVSETVKKGIFHQHGLDSDKLKKEIGDVLWYVAALCTTLEFDMGEIMQMNIDKLKVRYPEGFSVEDSQKRVDKANNQS